MDTSNASPLTSMPNSPEQSSFSESSEATEASPYSSDQPEARTSKSAATTGSSPSLPAIQYEHRVFVTGMNGSGKSEAAKAIFLSTAAPRLVIDPADSTLTASVVDEGGTFSDPKRIPNVATARFVPRDPEDRDIYDELYRQIYARGPRAIWLDEAGIAAPANGYPKMLNTVVVQGRKRQIFHLACHTRPREMCKNLLAQATHVFVFDLPNSADRAYVADNIGVPTNAFERELAQLPKYGFLWWNQEARRLTVCPPLKLK